MRNQRSSLPRFYCPQLEDSALPDEVVQHLKVLRMAAGDDIVLFDGHGKARNARITQIDRRRADVALGDWQAIESSFAPMLTLAQALLSAEKMDWVVQKATELGAAAILPVVSERCWKLDPDRVEKRMAHWRAVIIAACEQCGRNRLPDLQSALPLEQLPDHGWWLTLGQAPRLRDLPPPGQLTLLVGPEGGWTAKEEAWMQGRGWQAVSLGSRVLRTETAGLAALAAAQALWGDG